MNDWKPKNLDEALDDAIGSAINDNNVVIDLHGFRDTILHEDKFDEAIKQAIKNIKAIKGLTIIFNWEEKEEK